MKYSLIWDKFPVFSPSLAPGCIPGLVPKLSRSLGQVEITWCKLTKGNRQCGLIESMKSPLFIRPLAKNERGQIQAGLRSKDAYEPPISLVEEVA